MFYSKSTNGFYDISIHGNQMPVDVVEITEEVYVDLLNGQGNGKNIAANESGHPILVDSPSASYQILREMAYPSFLDYIDGVVKNDQEQINAYIAACQAVKAKFPKP
jgi:hypothetical protein